MTAENHRATPARAQLSADGFEYAYTFSDAIRFAFASLRQKLLPRPSLIAGPYAGEFGWELMQWQGYVRARKRHYQEVHVITYPGRDYLYEGCRVHHHALPLHSAGHRYGKLPPAAVREIARTKAAELGLKHYDVFSPDLIWTHYHKRLFWKQEFRLFREAPIDGSIRDIAFHFRSVEKAGEHPKNYSGALAEQLVGLCRQNGFSVICIGHPEYAICPGNAEDQRSTDLQQTVAAICSARLVAGANSGPMHLANLCGKPTVLWAYDQSSIDFSLRWNPFRVPIYTAANNTHEPSPQRVCAAIEEALKDLKVKTDSFSKPAYSLPPQRIAYC